MPLSATTGTPHANDSNFHGSAQRAFSDSIRFCNEYTIAFVFENPSSFTLQDLRILSRTFRVVPLQWTGVVSFVKLLRATLHSDLVFVWWVTGQASSSLCCEILEQNGVLQ